MEIHPDALQHRVDAAHGGAVRVDHVRVPARTTIDVGVDDADLVLLHQGGGSADILHATAAAHRLGRGVGERLHVVAPAGHTALANTGDQSIQVVRVTVTPSGADTVHGWTTGRAEGLADRLDLTAHVEGGYYRETYRSPTSVTTHNGPRSAATIIFYLLDADSRRGRLHRNTSDITHIWQAGDPVTYALIGPDGHRADVTLGPNPDCGHQSVMTCPGGWWKASRLAATHTESLVAEIVAPGFDYADAVLATPGLLARDLPAGHDSLADLLT